MTFSSSYYIYILILLKIKTKNKKRFFLLLFDLFFETDHISDTVSYTIGVNSWPHDRRDDNAAAVYRGKVTGKYALAVVYI